MLLHLFFLFFALLLLSLLVLRVELHILPFDSRLESGHFVKRGLVPKDLLFVEPLDGEDLFLLLEVVCNLLEVFLVVDCHHCMRLKHLPEADVFQVHFFELVSITLLLDEIVNNVILEELSHCLSLG